MDAIRYLFPESVESEDGVSVIQESGDEAQAQTVTAASAANASEGLKSCGCLIPMPEDWIEVCATAGTYVLLTAFLLFGVRLYYKRLQKQVPVPVPETPVAEESEGDDVIEDPDWQQNQTFEYEETVHQLLDIPKSKSKSQTRVKSQKKSKSRRSVTPESEDESPVEKRVLRQKGPESVARVKAVPVKEPAVKSSAKKGRKA